MDLSLSSFTSSLYSSTFKDAARTSNFEIGGVCIPLSILVKYITERLNLRLNKKSKYFPNKKGTDFCGYVIYPTHIKLIKRFKNKLKKNTNL